MMDVEKDEKTLDMVTCTCIQKAASSRHNWSIQQNIDKNKQINMTLQVGEI